MELHSSTPGTRPVDLRLDQDYLREQVERLSFPRAYGSAANAQAEELVAEELHRLLGSCFRVGKTRNLGSGNFETARILIGAHYDSVPGTPGADDNASAVAVLLGVAQVLGPRPDTLYVAFNAEECALAGSREFVRETAGALALEQVHVLEMVGYRDSRPGSQKNPLPMLSVPTTGDFLGVISNQEGLIRRITDAGSGVDVRAIGLPIPEGLSLAAIGRISPHLLRSDHTPFWEQGIPAVMWTDTAESRNPHYHQPTDTPETLDYAFMAEVGKLLALVVGAC